MLDSITFDSYSVVCIYIYHVLVLYNVSHYVLLIVSNYTMSNICISTTCVKLYTMNLFWMYSFVNRLSIEISLCLSIDSTLNI